MRTFLAAAALSTALSGCTLAEFDSINRSFSPETGDSRFVDIKQRAIYSVRRPVFDPFSNDTIKYTDVHGNKRVLNTTVVCAEPSPDAMQSTALALAGEASSAQLQAAISGSLGLSNSAVSVGLRTQAITLLRDVYYRLCEGLSNGGLDDIAFNILQQRFQNHMIALLAVEQLTGATVAAQGTTQSEAAGDAGANVARLMDATNQASDELAGLLAQEATIDRQIAALGTPTEEAQKRQLEGLQIRKAELAARIGARRETLANAQSALATASGNSPDVSVESSAALGNQTTRTGGALPAHVSAAVTAITLGALNQDYGLQICTELARNLFTKADAAAIALRRNPARPEESVVEGIQKTYVAEIMQTYCTARLSADAAAHQAKADSSGEKRFQITQIIERLSSKQLTPEQAAALLKALNTAVPNSVPAASPDFGPLVQMPASSG